MEGLSAPAGTHRLLASSYIMTVALTWHTLDSLMNPMQEVQIGWTDRHAH